MQGDLKKRYLFYLYIFFSKNITFSLNKLNISLSLFNFRWTGLLEEIAERLKSSKALLQLWQRYKELHEQSCCSIQHQEEKADQLLKSTCSKDIADEDVSNWIREYSVSWPTVTGFENRSILQKYSYSLNLGL